MKAAAKKDAASTTKTTNKAATEGKCGKDKGKEGTCGEGKCGGKMKKAATPATAPSATEPAKKD